MFAEQIVYFMRLQIAEFRAAGFTDEEIQVIFKLKNKGYRIVKNEKN